jgi:hypothetical protein
VTAEHGPYTTRRRTPAAEGCRSATPECTSEVEAVAALLREYAAQSGGMPCSR